MEKLIELLNNADEWGEIINDLSSEFETPVWDQYLTPKFTTSLSWNAMINTINLSPMASVVDYSGDKPLRSHPGSTSLSGRLTTFGNSYTLSKEEMREIMEIEDNIGKYGIEADALIEQIRPYIKRLSVGADKTLDYMLLQALSTGKMTMDNTVNPQGIQFDLDWGIQTETTAIGGGITWDNPTATPLTDMRNLKRKYQKKGMRFIIARMSQATFDEMLLTNELADKMGYELPVDGDGKLIVGSVPFVKIEDLNRLFVALGLPPVEVVDHVIPIEKADGTIIESSPFADSRVSFVTSQILGNVRYSFTNEDRMPNPEMTYAKSNLTQLATKIDRGAMTIDSELNAFPVLDMYKRMVILQTDETA